MKLLNNQNGSIIPLILVMAALVAILSMATSGGFNFISQRSGFRSVAADSIRADVLSVLSSGAACSSGLRKADGSLAVPAGGDEMELDVPGVVDNASNPIPMEAGVSVGPILDVERFYVRETVTDANDPDLRRLLIDLQLEIPGGNNPGFAETYLVTARYPGGGNMLSCVGDKYENVQDYCAAVGGTWIRDETPPIDPRQLSCAFGWEFCQQSQCATWVDPDGDPGDDVSGDGVGDGNGDEYCDLSQPQPCP